MTKKILKIDYFKCNWKTEHKPVWSHSYDETWELDDDMYCPGCGTQGSVWSAMSGDYYAGSQNICSKCGFQCYNLSEGYRIDKDIQDRQRLELLRGQ